MCPFSSYFTPEGQTWFSIHWWSGMRERPLQRRPFWPGPSGSCGKEYSSEDWLRLWRGGTSVGTQMGQSGKSSGFPLKVFLKSGCPLTFTHRQLLLSPKGTEIFFFLLIRETLICHCSRLLLDCIDWQNDFCIKFSCTHRHTLDCGPCYEIETVFKVENEVFPSTSISGGFNEPLMDA